MANRYVRSSSFRHVHGEAAKVDKQFSAFRSTGKQISANDKYMAVALAGGGGPVAIAELDDPGRHPSYFQIQVHSSAVECAEFSPFAVNLLATSSTDAYIKLSQIPEGKLLGQEPVTKALRELQGHFKKVEYLRWNPTASDCIASASPDNTVKIWNIEAQSEAFSAEIDQPTCLNWNENGSRVVVGSKDTTKFHLYDPRVAPTESDAYQGFAKKFNGTEYTFADNHGMLLGVGKSKTNGRQFGMWDLKKLDTPVQNQDIDRASGKLEIMYDPDCSIMYLAGQGDAAISYYELSKGQLHFLTSYSDTQPQKSVAWRPKRACNVKSCEIASALRLMPKAGGDFVVPVSFQVPRKSDLFQKDLYPDTYAGEPSTTFEEWQGGKDGEVKKQSMQPGQAVEKVAVSVVAKKTPSEMEAEIAALKAEVERLKKKCGEA